MTEAVRFVETDVLLAVIEGDERRAMDGVQTLRPAERSALADAARRVIQLTEWHERRKNGRRVGE